MPYSLQTPIKLPTAPASPLSYGQRLLSLGSCFSEHIGKSLSRLGHHICVNPFGTLYNPASISECLDRLMLGLPFGEKDLFLHKDLYHSPLHHGSYSSPEGADTLKLINQDFEQACEALSRLDYLLITWGTAWIYTDKARAKVVANCHKRPEADFDRRLWSVDELSDRVATTLYKLFELRPDLQIISTISPIRHLRDTAHGNQLSKSTLLLMDDKLRQTFGKERYHYFPAYEIVLDELRDYRFYADDMTHPAPLTQRIIAERFAEWLMSPQALATSRQVEHLRRQFEHRPLHPDSLESALQRDRLEMLLASFLSQHPSVRW